MKKIMFAAIGIVILEACEEKNIFEQPEQQKQIQESQTEQSEKNTEPQATVEPIVGEWMPTSANYVETIDGEVVRQGTFGLNYKYLFYEDGTGTTLTDTYSLTSNYEPYNYFNWAREEDKIVFHDRKFADLPGIALGKPIYAYETEWIVCKLTDTELEVTCIRPIYGDPNTDAQYECRMTLKKQ